MAYSTVHDKHQFQNEVYLFNGNDKCFVTVDDRYDSILKIGDSDGDTIHISHGDIPYLIKALELVSDDIENGRFVTAVHRQTEFHRDGRKYYSPYYLTK